MRVQRQGTAYSVLAGTLAAVVGVLALAGCSGQPTAAAARPPAGSGSPPAPSSARVTVAPGGLPPACALVSPEDVSLMVGMDDWQYTEQAAGDHAVCAYRGRGGVQVTAVVSRLGVDGRPPAGVCAPPGAQPQSAHGSGHEACRYTGPAADSTTVVVAGHGLAVGVRVSGHGAGSGAGGAAALAEHALTHL